ncbi:hypothetical protein [Pseudomonas sp. PB3P13]
MPTESEEGRQIAAALTHRIGDTSDIAKIANAIIATLHDMHAALAPIIGEQGVMALFRRSFILCSKNPRLASMYHSVLPSVDLTALKIMLLKQSAAEALYLGEHLLTSLYQLLITLIGPSLTAKLLRSVLRPSLSDTPSQDTSS